MMNDQILSKYVEQTTNCGVKIDYKNCASRWSLTHCNMMHGAHNVRMTYSFVRTSAFHTTDATETQQNGRCPLHNSYCVLVVLKLKVAVTCLNCGFLGMTPTSLVSGYKLSADYTASIFRVGDRRQYVSPKRLQVPVTLQDVTVANAPDQIFTVKLDSNVFV